MAIRIDNTRYICRKTFTNGRDYEVKEEIFSLTITYDREAEVYRVVNLTNNLTWGATYKTLSAATAAIKNGSWTVIDERKPSVDYTMKDWQKSRQYDIPRRVLNDVYIRYPEVTVCAAKDLYTSAVICTLAEAGVDYIDEGDLSFGRGLALAREKFFDMLDNITINRKY